MSGILYGERIVSGHDVTTLLHGWKLLCESRGWKLTTICESGGFPVFAVENSDAGTAREDAVYLSTGVHGDECAPPWALLEWAESLPEDFSRPFLFFPCLNPVGLRENTRVDEDGFDLNRLFQDPEIPVIRAWQEFLEGRRFATALNLHEDYDATGIYLYEIARGQSKGHRFLSACEEIIPRETAATVDGAEFSSGLLSHGEDVDSLRELVEQELGGGWPEAIWLYVNHAQDSFTFETPSEMELRTRVAAHRRFLETVVG